jgi:hypothetical protein
MALTPSNERALPPPGRVSASHSYLVTTRLPCDGFQDTEHLNYNVTVGKLTDRDKLLVRRSSGHMQGCFIDTLFELEKIKNLGSDRPCLGTGQLYFYSIMFVLKGRLPE